MNNIEKLLQKGLRKKYLTAPKLSDVYVKNLEYFPTAASNLQTSMIELKIVIGVYIATLHFYPLKALHTATWKDILLDIKSKFNSTKKVSHLKKLETLLDKSGAFEGQSVEIYHYHIKMQNIVKKITNNSFTAAIKFGVLTDEGLEVAKQIQKEWNKVVVQIYQSIETLKKAEEEYNIIRGANRGTDVSYLNYSLNDLKFNLDKLDQLIAFNVGRR